MSGPQGSDPTQPWAGQQPAAIPRGSRRLPISRTTEHPPGVSSRPRTAAAVPAVPAARPARAISSRSYQQPDQYGQQPTAYGPSSYPQRSRQYGQPAQYGQPPAPSTASPASTASTVSSRAVRPSSSSRRTASHRTEAGSKKSHGAHPRRRRRPGGRRGRSSVGVLGFWKPGFFVTTNLDVNGRAVRCAADPQRRDQRLRRQERRGRQLQRRREPEGREGRHLRLRGQHRRHQAPGDGDVPGRQRHLRGRSAPASAQAGSSSSAFCRRAIDDVTPYSPASSATLRGCVAVSGSTSDAVDSVTFASVATRTTFSAAAM